MDRFEQVVKYQFDKWDSGEAVHITAGALLKDNVTYKELVQLKLQNVSKMTVSSVIVVIALLDEKENKLGDTVHYSYTGLEAGEGDVFGNKEAIELPVTGVSSFKATVTEVTFKEGFTWKLDDDKDDIYEQYKEKVTAGIREKIQKDDFDGAKAAIESSAELVDAKKLQDEIYEKMLLNADTQIRETKNYDAALEILNDVPDDFDGKAEGVEEAYKGYLESAKKKSEDGDPEAVLTILDKVPDDFDGKSEVIDMIPGAYITAASKQVAKGNIEAAEATLENVEESSSEKDGVLKAISDAKAKRIQDAKKRKKIIIIAVIVLVLIVIGTIVGKAVGAEMERSNKYNEAMSLYESGRYYEAQNIFESLNGYKESDSYADQCDQKIKEEKTASDYEAGVEAFNEGKMSIAHANLSELQGYKDADDYLAKIEQYASVLKELKAINEDYDDKDYGKAKLNKALEIIDKSEFKTTELNDLASVLKAMKKFLGIYHQSDDEYEILDGEITMAFYVFDDVDDDPYSIRTDRFALSSYDADEEYWFNFALNDDNHCYYSDEDDEYDITVERHDDGSLTLEDEYDDTSYKFAKGAKKDDDDDDGSSSYSTGKITANWSKYN